jgi:hypothetical protein
MAKAFADIEAGGDAASLGHAEWLALLLEREASLRRDKRLSKRLQYAKLRQQACIEDIDYRTPRGLDRSLLTMLILSRICQHLPLRPGQAGSPRVLLKSLLKKPSDVMQQESQRGRIRFHEQIFISLLMISSSSY